MLERMGLLGLDLQALWVWHLFAGLSVGSVSRVRGYFFSAQGAVKDPGSRLKVLAFCPRRSRFWLCRS